MIKIAFVIDTIQTPAAGTEKQLLMLLNGLDRTQFSPYLICLRNSEWLDKQKFPFPLIVYNLKRIFSLSFLKHLRKFIHFVQSEQLDIVQMFFVDGNIFGITGARLAGCKNVISSRRNMGDWHNRLHISILRFLRRWTGHYLSNSEAAAAKTVEVEGVLPSRITVIYNGLDLQRFQSLSPDKRSKQRREWNIADNETLIGTVANLRSVKNVASFIRTATQLDRDFPSLKYVVVGDGNDREKLQNLIDTSGLTDKFHLAGRYPDAAPCLAAFDIAVMCSKFESFSNSLIEYMAAGLPIVASNVGGNGEAISHNENGLLYPVDDEKGLENGLRVLLSDRSLAARLGESARESAFRRFSREAYIQSHQDYYKDLMKTDTL